MLVSWNWLKEYIDLDSDRDLLEERLTLSGLNHEGTFPVGDDVAIDLEVTSNRPDCLGHIGVAREIGVLYDRPLSIPTPCPAESATPVSDLVKVRIDCPERCCRYTARVIRGVTIGPSPDWLVERLRTIFQPLMPKNEVWKPVNNVVDITNYVLMECGQPLHAFDFSKIAGNEIIVREAMSGEKFAAIDHATYELEPPMCVIADQTRAIALGGVMGGAETEISAATTDILIESAEFDPLTTRTTARRLKLHSPSSYRFERGVDPEAVDWASRRCCALILELAGGELAKGVVDVGEPIPQPQPIVLRLSQLERILGIEIPTETVRRILVALGHQEKSADTQTVEVVPPSWRRDLTREIDLVEEVGRIYGYDHVPEDARVPMAASHCRDEDRVLNKVRGVLVAAGYYEAITPSVVTEKWAKAISLFGKAEPVAVSTSMLRGADRLRQSVVPSLLGVRKTNEAASNTSVHLFEIAKVYLPCENERPSEETMVALTTGRDFSSLKGVVEAIVATLCPDKKLVVRDAKPESELPLLDSVKSCRFELDGELFGYLGEVSEAGLKQFGLRTPATVAELRFSTLVKIAELIPKERELSPFPAVTQDLNLIVEESLRWEDLKATVWAAGGESLEQVAYQEIYRNTDKDGPNKKRLLLSIALRSAEKTLTGAEVESIRDQIVEACRKQHNAVLLG